MRKSRKSVKPSLVVASTAPDLPAKLELATYGCKSCSHVFASNAGFEPFCVKCGSDEVEPELDDEAIDVSALPEDEEDLSALQCPECSTTNIVTDAMVLSFAGKIHCSACGSELSYDAEAVDGGDAADGAEMDADGDTADDLVDDDELFTENPETQEVEVDASKGNPTTACGDDKNVQAKTKAKAKAVKATAGEEANPPPAATTADEDEMSKPPVEGLDPATTTAEPGEITADTMAETEEVPLVDVVDGEEAARDKQCSFVAISKNTILAFVRDVAVARLDNRDDSRHAEVFGTQPHMKAMMASLHTNGLDKTLADFDFKLAKIKIKASVLKRKMLEQAAVEEKAKIRQELASSVTTLKQCLGIAAAGLNKNFFKGKSHVLKANLFEALTASGIRKPERIIDSVFSSTSDVYHRTLIEIAMELMDKPTDIRNSMAEAIGDANYVATPEDDQEGGDDAAGMEDRLEQGLTPATETSSVDAGIVNSHQSIGRGRLFSIR